MKFHRQLLALSLSAALTAGMTITASAQGTVTVSVNGTKSNVSAFTNADWRTMVPAEIADSLGLSYTAQDSSVTFTGNGISQTYTAGVPVGDTTPAMVAGKLYLRSAGTGPPEMRMPQPEKRTRIPWHPSI